MRRKLPRALVSPVRCMARPRRPEAEARAVREAAGIVRSETQLTSARAVSRAIAARVVDELFIDLDGDPLDIAFAAIERTMLHSPFQRLVSCPDIDTASEFVERRVERMRARSGRYLSPTEQALERRAIRDEVHAALTGRYDRHLRSC